MTSLITACKPLEAIQTPQRRSSWKVQLSKKVGFGLSSTPYLQISAMSHRPVTWIGNKSHLVCRWSLSRAVFTFYWPNLEHREWEGEIGARYSLSLSNYLILLFFSPWKLSCFYLIFPYLSSSLSLHLLFILLFFSSSLSRSFNFSWSESAISVWFPFLSLAHGVTRTICVSLMITVVALSDSEKLHCNTWRCHSQMFTFTYKHTRMHVTWQLWLQTKVAHFRHRQEVVSYLPLVHVIVVNIFIPWFCEVTVPLTARRSLSQNWKWAQKLPS